MVLEKTPDSTWTAWRSNQSILKEINPEYSLEGRMLKLHWSSDVNSWFIGKVPDAGKDWRQKEKRVTEYKMAGQHHWFNGHELGQTLGDSEGQGSLVCCSPCSMPGSQRIRHDWATEQKQHHNYFQLLCDIMPKMFWKANTALPHDKIYQITIQLKKNFKKLMTST